MQLRLSSVTLVACAALIWPQIALAQQQCLDEAEVAALAVYAAPSAIRGTQARCSDSLRADGWLATNGEDMAMRYESLGDETWPSAKPALIGLMDKSKEADSITSKSQTIQHLSALPDDSMRPIVDALILQLVSEKIKPASCGEIERVLEVLSRFEPRDLGDLVGVILSLVNDKGPKICKAMPA